jgi:deoxyinosine 3'endonuclease (endonuclease V)
MKEPYVPGFLAYREAPFLLKKLDKLKATSPWLYPHCIFIDGNGTLHSNRFGCACHIGLVSETPTIGVSKKLHHCFGLENNEAHKSEIKEKLKKQGDHFGLYASENDRQTLLGYCYRATNDSTNPIYVSIGDRISWETCLWLMNVGYGGQTPIWKYRIPEPIRQADILTREYLRNF